MPDVTIHFDPEKADLLRKPMGYHVASASDDLNNAANDYWYCSRGTAPQAEAVERMKKAATEIRSLFGVLDQLGWELGTRAKSAEVTVDPDWLRRLMMDGFTDQTDNLETEASTEYLRTALEASEFYDALEDQLPPEPAKVEA